MHRRMVVQLFVLVCAVVAAPARSADRASSTTTASPIDLAALIDKLSDPDPAVRSLAVSRLTAMGTAARGALVMAARSSGPEARMQASHILLKLPWFGPDDSDLVKQAMVNYGNLDVDDRMDRVHALAELTETGGQEVLIRILQEDPSASVRWAATGVLRTAGQGNKPPLARLRALWADTNGAARQALPDDAPLLAAMGWAWREVDAGRCGDLLSRAVLLEAEQSTAVRGQLDFAFAWLVDRATEQQRYTDAVSLLRQQAATTGFSAESVPSSVANLFALHAEHGPFEGFRLDLQTYRPYLSHPELMYALGRLAERQGYAMLSPVIEGVALLAGGLTADRHTATGSFLSNQGWSELAERELRTALWLSDGKAINVYFQLARLAAEREDELAVAQNLQAAIERVGDQEMRRTTKFGDVLPWTRDDAWAEVHWHYLRAARAAGDVAAVQEHLQKLMDLNRLQNILHKDPGLATDLIPALQETGRKEDAKKCFDAAYKDLSDAIAADPTSAEAKNNLAWLCARCGERLDEAVKLADEAVAAAPGSAAYLDTAAEAHFRNGDPATAVRLETEALKLRPKDAFMKGQLERFKRALLPSPAAPGKD